MVLGLINSFEQIRQLKKGMGNLSYEIDTGEEINDSELKEKLMSEENKSKSILHLLISPNNHSYKYMETENGLIFYTVKKGDYLSLLSRKFNIPLMQILHENPHIKDPNLIDIGDRLKLKLSSVGYKVKLMHYWGNEVRREELAVRHNPYARFICSHFNDEQKLLKRLKEDSSGIEACIVPSFEVVPYVSEFFNRIYILPIATDLEIKEGEGEIGMGRNKPLIVHKPIQPYSEETVFIEEALERIRVQGYSFDYVRLENMTPETARSICSMADILIEQLLCGFYGSFAVDGMAMGKPVISYIREDLKFLNGGNLPIISANPANIDKKLICLILDPSLRHKTGEMGKTFVKQNHKISVVSRQLDWIYRQEFSMQTSRVTIAVPKVFQFVGSEIYIYRITEKRCLRIESRIGSLE